MKQTNISQVDALFSNESYPIEFLFYYKEAFHTQKIRRALRKLSSVFWPAFGEYRDGIISFDSYHEEDCYDEEVVDQEFNIRLIEETGFEGSSPFCLPDLKRLFFLKAIRLKNGLVLIPKMNHLAGDGYSYFTFLSRLAALSQPAVVPLRSSLINMFFKPHHARTILRDFSFKGMALEPVPQNVRHTLEVDEISRADVQSMISHAASADHLRISTNDVLSAMAVKKIVARQAEFWGENVQLTIPIDVRRQVKDYGLRFFGNGIMLHRTSIKRESLENSPIKDIAIEIRKSMPSVSKETYINYLIDLERILSLGKTDEFKPFDPRRGCLVTNLSKLPSDKLNFGAGFPELIIPLTSEKNSAGILSKKENYILRFAY